MGNLLTSVQFSRSVVSDSLRPHEPQHSRPPCPSTPGVHPNPCPLSRWCHPTISSSVIPFSSCPQSFPASGAFQMSQLSTSGGQSIGVSALTSVPPVNTQGWSPLGWTGWISLQSKGLSRVFSNTTVQKHQFFCAQLSSQSNSHIHTWPLENHCLDWMHLSELTCFKPIGTGFGIFSLFLMSDSFDMLSSRTGHLCGRPLTALCPVWLGLCVPHHIRDNHGVLHGSLQPHQLLVFS